MSKRASSDGGSTLRRRVEFRCPEANANQTAGKTPESMEGGHVGARILRTLERAQARVELLLSSFALIHAARSESLGRLGTSGSLASL